jgi:hypothetical protein
VRLTAPFRFLANISYSLYVIHPIAGYVTMRLLTAAGLPYLAALALRWHSSSASPLQCMSMSKRRRSRLASAHQNLIWLARAAGGACRRSARSAGANSARLELSQPLRGSPILGPPVANVKRHDKEAAVAVGRSMSRDPWLDRSGRDLQSPPFFNSLLRVDNGEGSRLPRADELMVTLVCFARII